MSDTIENIYTLYNNPFLLSPIIVKFYEKYHGTQDKDILLSYLIFPIVLYEPSMICLLTKKKELRTFISYEKGPIKKHEKLYGLADRIDEYKEMTNLCIQYCVDNGNLKIGNDLSISFIKSEFKRDNTIVGYLKAAENMAIMLGKEKLSHIYLKLGIKKL